MESSALFKKECAVENAKICRWCLSNDDALEAVANDDSEQYKLQKLSECTGAQINFIPGVPSYLCTICEARLKKMDLFRWRYNEKNDMVDRFIEQQNTAKDETEISQEHFDHSAEQTVGTELSIKTEDAPDEAKNLHLNQQCCTVHQANSTFECCGNQPFEAEEKPITIKLEFVDVDEQYRLQMNAILDHEQDDPQTNPVELVFQDREDHSLSKNMCEEEEDLSMSKNMCADGTKLSIKTDVTSPDIAKHLHLNQKCLNVHQANSTYECCGKIPDDLFEAEENPIAIKSEYEEVDEQHQLQTTNGVPLDSICQDQKDHPVTVADNMCADDSAVGLTQNVLTRKVHSKSHSRNHKHHCKYPDCFATYPSLGQLKIHIRSHTGERPHQCKVCDKAFYSPGTLAEHLRIHNKDEQYQCPHCSSTFPQSYKLKKHIQTHTGEKPLQCEICDKSFYSSGSLANHSKIHNKDKQYLCHHCSAMFAKSSSLKIHIRTHSGEKPYKCKVCDESFHSSTILARHQKIHNKDQQHQCPHCSSKFPWLSSLKNHIRTHTDERPYVCKICGEAFHSSQVLEQHSKVHNKDDRLRCPHCSLKFPFLHKLKDHIRTHTGERPYKCKVCDKAFRTSGCLSQHLKNNNKHQPRQCSCCKQQPTATRRIDGSSHQPPSPAPALAEPLPTGAAARANSALMRDGNTAASYLASPTPVSSVCGAPVATRIGWTTS